ncbi:PREDICTED: uncharacterized protein LOC108558132 isoform X2 [Nicrophorus vespilloides]|nr:PREDICTED: uncharacterized protein LOC108558132 isoform X2 [Nicrophorus vespilloides]
MVLVLFVLFCLCWKKKESKSLHELCNLDKSDLSMTEGINITYESSSTSFFRRFSNAALINPTFKFNGPDSEKILTAYEQSKSLPIERDLMDSLDIQKQFNQSVLQIDNNYVHIDQDDAKSCRSLDSRHSFYSIYPFTRSHSVADTMKSAYSGPDSLEDC